MKLKLTCNKSVSAALIVHLISLINSEQYIISVKPNSYNSIKSRLFKAARARAFDVEDVKINQFYGFIGNFDNQTISEFTMNKAGINYIEKDSYMKIQLGLPNNGINDISGHEENLILSSKLNPNFDIQSTPSNWGLGRISNKKKTKSSSSKAFFDFLFGNDNKNEMDDDVVDMPNEYTYYKSSGKDIDVYIIDTGINDKHPEFESRAKFLKNFAEDNIDTDSNGHGTHVAGIIGSKTYGVCKKCNLFGLKVLGADGSGSTSNIIKAIQYVVDAKAKNKSKGTVINMSLGGGLSNALNDAIKQAYMSDIAVVVAAGNENTDACTTSPASAEYALSVGNSDITDTLHYSSNYGKCVQINAPGTNILSTYKNTVKSLTGTSMASPHVAGVAALFLGENSSKNNKFKISNTKDLYDRIIGSSTQDVVTTNRQTAKNLLYNKMNNVI